MGILNAFICIPQIAEMLIVGLYYDKLLSGDPRLAIFLAGICLVLGAIACLFITKDLETETTTNEVFESEASALTLGEV